MKTNWRVLPIASLLVVMAALASSSLAGTSDSKPLSALGAEVPAKKAEMAIVSDVRLEKGKNASTVVRISGTGSLNYEVTQLNSPDRLVFDFAGAQIRVGRRPLEGQSGPVQAIRFGQFQPEVARVVIDLKERASYDVSREANAILVSFGQETAGETAEVVDEHSAGLLSTLPKPATAVDTGSGGSETRNGGKLTPTALKESVGEVGLTEKVEAPDARAEKPVPAQPVEGKSSPAAAPATAPPNPGQYTGEPISVNLKDVDLKDFFRLIHEISGLNVVLDPSVKGSLTIVLDEVPWDQALDLVLRNNNLDKQVDGNVIRIATRDTLKKEAEIQRDLAKAQAEAVDQVTATRVLSYAKAATIRDLLKQFLSPRGEILADERANMLIIRDIPSVLPEMDNLIRQLDRKSQQVEIEARVVAASRTFAREIGTQLAFAGSATGGRNIIGGSSDVGTSPVGRTPPPPLVVAGTSSLPLVTDLLPSVPTSGIGYFHTSPNFALDLVIAAAESKGVGKLLSKPKVITQNNERAIVKQGTKIPIQTTINNTISVQFIDAVLQLQVTPQITAEGTVFMKVLVENTQINPGIPRVLGIPALDTQAAETNVLVADGGTVVIGGVIVSSQRTDVKQVPLLGSIPVIGHLFKNTSVNVSSQELMFFLTPRIIPN